MRKTKFWFSQTRIIAFGFFLLIAAGTLLLMLPISTKAGGSAGFFDALFTATSASCVTGLIVQDTYLYWSLFGQCVILLLIQIGGLGFMTIATRFFLAIRRKVGLWEREVLSESISSSQVGGVLRLTKRIICGTALFEGVGAILLAFRFCPQFGFWDGLFAAVFHSVSAFCNAGFDLMGRFGAYSSLTAYAGDWYVNLIIMALIILGGLGFLVWDDLFRNRWHVRRYRLHSKIVLIATGALLLCGTLLFFFLEGPASAKGLDMDERVLTSMFDAVTPRTAGFNTVDTASLSQSGKLLSVILMFIGGSPGSTAGGIKTTTIVVMLLYALSYMRRKPTAGLLGRRFEDGSLRKASAVFFTNLTLALSAAMLICGIQDFALLDVVFETFSAIGTVGMTTGITRDLGLVSQCVIVFLMYCGRVGSLSFASALAEKKQKAPVMEPAEQITIG